MTESTATEEALAADPALEVDEQLPFDPSAIPDDLPEELRQAFLNAQNGQYKHTFFEMFEDQLEGSLAATKADLTVEVATSILSTWRWLRYADLDMYLSFRTAMLEEAVMILHNTYPRKREDLFKEVEGDWKLHREAYIELMAQWTAQNIRWTKKFQALKNGQLQKAVLHCVLADLTYIIMGPEGLIEKFRYLAFFDHEDYRITDEEQEKLAARIKELSDE